MRLTVVQDGSDDIHTVEIAPEKTVADLKGMLETITGIPRDRQRISCQGAVPADAATVSAAGMSEDEMVALQVAAPASQRPPQPAAQPAAQASAPAAGGAGMPNFSGMAEQFQLRRQAEALRRQALQDANVLADLRNQAPPLAAAVNNSAQFAQIFLDAWRQQRSQQQLMADLDDPNNQTAEKQEKIMDMINQQRVLENRQAALQDYPEAFGSVTMLYVPVTVNGHEVKAFVDSGAQTTIMSPECAERCEIMPLLDKAFGGTAHGVGTSKILGRIHLAELKIADNHLMCSFSILEEKSVEMLLGLDMLKRHQATIDLEKNVLRISGKEVAFLPESEIPRKLVDPTEPDIEGPSGLKVGSRTGTVKAADAGEGSSGGASTAAGAAASQRQIEQLAQSSKEEEQQAKVKQLQEITGCSEVEATNALQICEGNVDAAAGMLLS